MNAPKIPTMNAPKISLVVVSVGDDDGHSQTVGRFSDPVKGQAAFDQAVHNLAAFCWAQMTRFTDVDGQFVPVDTVADDTFNL